MGNDLVARGAVAIDGNGNEKQLESELNRFAEEWNAIRVTFFGEGPDDVGSVAEWEDQVALKRVIKPSEDHDFASAWHLAVSNARNLIYCQLVPWSCKVLNTYGFPVLSGIPSPPTNLLPAHAFLEDLTLTSDLADAGTRVVVWSAASQSPETMRRSSEHLTLFWLWTGRLLKLHGAEVFADRVIVDALRALLRSLKHASPMVVPAAIAQAKVVDRETPVIPNSIRKLDKETFQIVFGSEAGEIKGAGAQRFVQICQWRRVSPTFLVVDTSAVKASGSVDANRTVGSQQIAKIQRQAEEMSPRQRNKFKRTSEERREEIEARLATSLPELEVNRLEAELETYRFYQNQLNRKSLTSPSACRETAQLSLKRLAQKQRAKGRPLLAELIDKCIVFDKTTYEFVYDGPNWEFLGF
jgi:hypothetical protein